MKIFNGNEQSSSKDIAKQRLKSLLSLEKNQISSEILDMIRSEIIQCVGDYYNLDREKCQVFVSEEKDDTAIVAVLPITKEFK